ncbi:unnamed protein product [Lepeophtheirus salmonis]|uniref:RNA methyltransferase n=1 Tax=Lepeophtheirus salmonis TaxID=72036 RepID=A0A7R8H9L4_LEPSM|nr:unnamed protein product [Lepeophtheirus salmonis]CAF2943156.1 unnamed protein product [Lepeophtheirus salmonis]
MFSLDILGIDLDPTLIDRAREKYINKDDLTFKCADILDSKTLDDTIYPFLCSRGLKSFDMVTCFSISMWIHLNAGDIGLERFFFQKCSMLGLYLILEPQPWKCYQTAARRMRIHKQPEFEEKKKFKGADQEWLTGFIDEITSKNGFKTIKHFGKTEWKRSVILYGKDSS